MRALLGIGLLVMIAADVVVGARLVGVWRQTRRLPELAIGSSLLLLGALGYPVSIAARSGFAEAIGSQALLGAAFAFQDLGCAAMAVATWCTYRRDTAWAKALCAGIGTALMMGWWGEASGRGFVLEPGGSAAYWLGFSGRALPFAWAAAESWRYHGLLRRRLAIGLGSPLVTDRFRLWAIGTSAVCLAFAVFGVAAVAGLDVTRSLLVLASTSLAGCVSGVSFWLAFLPPRRYLAYVSRTGASIATTA
jgi:hypothetical protein